MCKANPTKHVQAINTELTLKYYKLPNQLSKIRKPDILIQNDYRFQKKQDIFKIVLLVKVANLQEHHYVFVYF